MADKKVVLMAVCNYFNPDNRVFRAADAVQGMGYYVTVLAYHKNGLSIEETLGRNGFRLLRIPLSTAIPVFRQFNNFQKTKAFHRKAKRIAKSLKPEIVHCHDYNTLFLGIFCKKKFNSKVIYDCHEYFQDLNYLHRYPLIIRRKIARFERNTIGKYVDEMIVVSPGIAKLYQQCFRSEIHVLRNIPDLSGIDQNANLPEDVQEFLEEQGKHNRKLFLYLGTNTQKGRGMEFALNLLKELPEEYGMVSFGAKSGEEINYLSKKAKELDIDDRFMPFFTLSTSRLFKVAEFCYMGLSLIEPVYTSYYHSLPNKLFEYISMGLPVISSDIPDQSEIIIKNNSGLVIPFDLVKAKEIILGSVGKKYNPEMRHLFSWETEKKLFGKIYE